MNGADNFPLPFTSLRSIAGGKSGSYIMGAMFTPNYADKAQRLATSCEKFAVPYAIHEVPAVHRSISSRGTPDLAFTKANFIHHLLDQHKKPVLYVDADCEFLSEPDMLEPMAQSDCDFAVYNWLADEQTDAFAPVEITIANGPPIKNRFYIFTHSVEHFTTNQLICSGPVQFYGNSAAARLLLSEWFRIIEAFPGTADDECLDFAFNNLGPRGSGIKTRWLPKAYARYSWWIYVKPVINHSDMPNLENNFTHITDPTGKRRFYPERAEKRKAAHLFPRECIIDTAQRKLCLMVRGQLVAVGLTDQNFWL